jgi:hypothetical protein
MTGQHEHDWLEYSAGGVPTGEFFRGLLEDLRAIATADSQQPGGINRLQELCFVGLLSYFEAFCKDHFAYLLNLEPSLIAQLKAAGQPVDIDATHVAAYGDETGARLGFILASRYDFGTARKINALFGAALRVTPFSVDEARRFDSLLRDRHLLVHHGGVYTLEYLIQEREVERAAAGAFCDSRVVGKNDVVDALSFIETIARKLLRASYDALRSYLSTRGTQYSGERLKALEAMLWWGDGAA